MCFHVLSGNSQVKVKVKRIGSFSFLIERGQQDGKDISHNSETEGEGENKRSGLHKSSRLNKAGCETGDVDCVCSSSGGPSVGRRGKVRQVHDEASAVSHTQVTSD